MKKIFAVLAVVVLSINVASAKDIDRKLVKNATIKDVQPHVLNVIDLYKGVVTVKELDKVNNKYVVEYNGTTFLGLVGVSKFGEIKYPKALFSCNLKQQNDDVLISMRKVKYSGWFNSQAVFNHYKKLYQELEFNGFVVEEVK